MAKVEVVLVFERDTKNNARFNETVPGDAIERGGEVIGRVYLRRAEHVSLGSPSRIKVTIEAANA